MWTTFHKVAGGVLAVQLALVAYTTTRHDDSAPAKEVALWPGFDAAKLTKIAVYDRDHQTKPAVELARHDQAWIVSSAFDYPVDATRIADLLTPLAKMAAASPIATSPNRHKQLHVADADYERKLVVSGPSGDRTLYVGTAAGARRTAVRFGGDDRVFAVDGVAAYLIGTDARMWAETKYVDVGRDQLAKLELARGDTHVVFTRAAPDRWDVTVDGKPVAPGKGEQLDTALIDRVTADAAQLDLAAPADPKRDASAPTATLTIEPKPAGATGAASVAAHVVDVIADGDRYWVHERGRDRAIFVDKARLDSAITLDPAKLIKKVDPPAATAVPPPSMPSAPPPMPGAPPPSPIDQR